MRRPRTLVLATTAPLLLALSGCASPVGSGATVSPGEGVAGGPARDGRMTPVERSQLRERAIAELESQAFAEWALLRANAMEGLSEAPTRAEGVVRAGLADDNEGVRAIAAMLAGEMRLAGAAASLRAMRQDPSPLVRVGAIAGLAMMGEDVDQTPLASMLEHPREDVRRQAAFALGEIGNPSAIPLLRSAIKGRAGVSPGASGAIFRMQAAEAMVKLGDRESLNMLRAGLYPSEIEEMEAAVIACQILGEVSDQGAVKQLVEIVEFVRSGTS
ncbi:MAG: HEAT repeat domain-containing protein, partial [Planctomycetota bacterium]